MASAATWIRATSVGIALLAIVTAGEFSFASCDRSLREGSENYSRRPLVQFTSEYSPSSTFDPDSNIAQAALRVGQALRLLQILHPDEIRSVFSMPSPLCERMRCEFVVEVTDLADAVERGLTSKELFEQGQAHTTRAHFRFSQDGLSVKLRTTIFAETLFRKDPDEAFGVRNFLELIAEIFRAASGEGPLLLDGRSIGRSLDANQTARAALRANRAVSALTENLDESRDYVTQFLADRVFADGPEQISESLTPSLRALRAETSYRASRLSPLVELFDRAEETPATLRRLNTSHEMTHFRQVIYAGPGPVPSLRNGSRLND